MKPKTKKPLVVVAALIILVGCYSGWAWYSSRYTRFPVHRLPGWSCFDAWRLSRTHSDLTAIAAAIEGFHAHYGHLPLNSPQRDYQFSITLGHDLNGQLTNLDRINPHQIVFWDVPAGEQRDGWGRLYHYHFDHDANGRVNTGHREVSCSYCVWSDGPDGVSQEGAEDDVSVQGTIGSP